MFKLKRNKNLQAVLYKIIKLHKTYLFLTALIHLTSINLNFEQNIMEIIEKEN